MILIRLIMLFLAVAMALSAEARTAGEPPNIILFIVDDLGWQDISVPLHSESTPFNERYHTPHVARLAREGLAFTNAYASAPVCTPSRTSIMTGKAPARTHITYWTLHADQDTTREHPLLRAPAWRMNGLQPEDGPTLPQLLKHGGYRTIHVGKAHFGAHGTPGGDPTTLGFEVNIAGHASGAPGSFLSTHRFANGPRNGRPDASSVWDVPGLEAYHDQSIYLTEALTIEAQRAIRESIEREQPFFLNFAPYAVHTPIMANERYLARYEHLHPTEAAYATMIESVDAALGALMHTLEVAGQLDNTIIIFTSDNGGLSAHGRGGEANTHNAPLRSGKGSAYEGGVRVPAIVRWPGVTPADARSDAIIIGHDWFPTILAMAGITLPEAHTSELDGRDLTPALRSADDPWPDRTVHFHMPHTWGARGPGIWPFSSIRSGRWKLIYFHADRRFELYDLAYDLAETINLAEWHPDRIANLAAQLGDWCRSVNAQPSIDRRTDQPVEWPDSALRD